MKNSRKFKKSLADWYNNRLHWSQCKTNREYLARHPELEYFNMPKTFYFRHLPDRCETHWAIIVANDNWRRSRAVIHFINDWGRVFDQVEVKNKNKGFSSFNEYVCNLIYSDMGENT